MSRSTAFCLGLAVFGLAGTPAFAAEAPPFKLVRSDEDYSYLRAAGPRTGADAVRFIPLDRDGERYLSLGGEARVRVDANDAPRFGVTGERADTFALARFLISADLHLGEAVRVYGELGLHRDLGKKDAPAPSDRNAADAQLAFLDVRPGARWRLRGGRQELMLSPTQRFIAVREGPNIRQAFDGVRVTRATPTLKLDAFYLRPVTIEPGAFNDQTNTKQRFYGVYASGQAAPGVNLDLYALGLDRDDVRFGAQLGDEHRVSAGARVAGANGAIDYEAEAMVQGGRFAGRKIRAWGGSLGAGYTFAHPWKPRLGLRLDAGSGDSNPADDRLETFNPLFPRGAYFNEAGLTSWSNLRASRASLGFSPAKGLALEVSYTQRDRATADDAIYLQPMQALAASAPHSAKAVSDTLQLDASFQATRNIRLQAQIARQDAGAAVKAAGGRDTDFAMLILQYRF